MMDFEGTARSEEMVSIVWENGWEEYTPASKRQVQFKGYRIASERSTEYKMISEDRSSFTVKYCDDEALSPRILTDTIDWFFTFHDDDLQTVWEKRPCNYIVDRKTYQTVAKISFVGDSVTRNSVSSYYIDSPDGMILIKSFADSYYGFFLENEKIAEFSIQYDPKHRLRRMGVEFPAFYSACCSDQISEITRVLLLSIPFLRNIGIGTDGKAEAEALKHFGSNERMKYLERYRTFRVSKCSVTFLLAELTPNEREEFMNGIGTVFPLQSYHWHSRDLLTISEIDIANTEEIEIMLLKLAEEFPHTEISIKAKFGPSPEAVIYGLDDHGGYITADFRDGKIKVKDCIID